MGTVYRFFLHFRVFFWRLLTIFIYNFFCDRFLREAAGKVPATSGEGGFYVERRFFNLSSLCVVSALSKDHNGCFTK